MSHLRAQGVWSAVVRVLFAQHGHVECSCGYTGCYQLTSSWEECMAVNGENLSCWTPTQVAAAPIMAFNDHLDMPFIQLQTCRAKNDCFSNSLPYVLASQKPVTQTHLDFMLGDLWCRCSFPKLGTQVFWLHSPTWPSEPFKSQINQS